MKHLKVYLVNMVIQILFGSAQVNWKNYLKLKMKHCKWQLAPKVNEMRTFQRESSKSPTELKHEKFKARSSLHPHLGTQLIHLSNAQRVP